MDYNVLLIVSYTQLTLIKWHLPASMGLYHRGVLTDSVWFPDDGGFAGCIWTHYRL